MAVASAAFALAFLPSAGVAGDDASSRAIDDACPEAMVPEDGYADVSSENSHERAVDCVTWWGIAMGLDDDTYAPAEPVTRAQMATFLARLIDRDGGTLSADPGDHFDDDDGSPHEDNINALADAGLIEGSEEQRFQPDASVTRAQMATFLVRTYEFRSGEELPEGGDHFSDDESSVHERNIDAAAHAGFTGGISADTYGPMRQVDRDAMASFLARVLDLRVEPHARSYDIDISVAITDSTRPVPFAVSATDVASFDEGGTATHQVGFTGDDRTVYLDDPRFVGVLEQSEGLLVTAGTDCEPSYDPGDPHVTCLAGFQAVRVDPGETTYESVSLYTRDDEIGPQPLRDGTYVLQQRVGWADDPDELPHDPDGEAVIEVTYRVSVTEEA